MNHFRRNWYIYLLMAIWSIALMIVLGADGSNDHWRLVSDTGRTSSEGI